MYVIEHLADSNKKFPRHVSMLQRFNTDKLSKEDLLRRARADYGLYDIQEVISHTMVDGQPHLRIRWRMSTGKRHISDMPALHVAHEKLVREYMSANGLVV